MNLEDKKQVASQAYALEHFTDVAHLNKMKDAWLDGFEAALPKWNSVEEQVPDSDRKVLCWINNTETPEWSGYRIGAYLGSWYCEGGRKSYEIVEKWLEIPQ